MPDVRDAKGLCNNLTVNFASEILAGGQDCTVPDANLYWCLSQGPAVVVFWPDVLVRIRDVGSLHIHPVPGQFFLRA